VPILFITVTEIQGPSGEDGTLGEGGEPGEQGSAGPTGGKGETGSRGQEVCNDNKIKKYKIKFPGTPNTS